jgi:transposase InsO family protein
LEITTEDDCLLWGLRVLIPEKFRKRILHDLDESHVGIVRMKAIARSHVWWPKLESDIEDIVRQCSSCATVAVNPAKAPLHAWDWPSRPWERLHIDLAGPFVGHMFLVYVDAHTKYSWVFEMKKTTSSDIIDLFLTFFSEFSLPSQIVSDYGNSFTSAECALFCKTYGIQHIRSAPFHPSTNGEAEKFVQTFKHAIKSMNDDSRSEGSLYLKLQTFLMRCRATPHSLTRRPPAELFWTQYKNTTRFVTSIYKRS